MFEKKMLTMKYDTDSLKKQNPHKAPCDPDCKTRMHLFRKSSSVPVPSEGRWKRPP